MTAHTDALDQLFTALVAVQAEMPSVNKGSENPFFKSSYADLADTLKTALPITSKHGLCITQWPSHNELGQDTLVTWIGHVSGQWIRDEMILHMAKPAPQEQGSATTYGKRYAAQGALGISTDKDDDGESATKRNGDSGALQLTPTSSKLSEAQLAALEKIHKTRNTDFQAGSLTRWGKSPDKLIKQEASRWLDELNGKVKPPEPANNGAPF